MLGKPFLEIEFENLKNILYNLNCTINIGKIYSHFKLIFTCLRQTRTFSLIKHTFFVLFTSFLSNYWVWADQALGIGVVVVRCEGEGAGVDLWDEFGGGCNVVMGRGIRGMCRI